MIRCVPSSERRTASSLPASPIDRRRIVDGHGEPVQPRDGLQPGLDSRRHGPALPDQPTSRFRRSDHGPARCSPLPRQPRSRALPTRSASEHGRLRSTSTASSQVTSAPRRPEARGLTTYPPLLDSLGTPLLQLQEAQVHGQRGLQLLMAPVGRTQQASASTVESSPSPRVGARAARAPRTASATWFLPELAR